METQSYNIIYLEDLSNTLGIMYEHITNLNVDPIIFWNKFINSNVAKQIEVGNPKYLNCSALDLLSEIYDKKISSKENIHKNEYYWTGWALAHLQQNKGYTFSFINNYLSIQDVLKLYPTLHEADITKFIDVTNNYFIKNIVTNLKRIREASGLSQSELAKQANVDLRSIQMYEQRRNDINKAKSETLFRISKVLGCSIEDLLEY